MAKVRKLSYNGGIVEQPIFNGTKLTKWIHDGVVVWENGGEFEKVVVAFYAINSKYYMIFWDIEKKENIFSFEVKGGAFVGWNSDCMLSFDNITNKMLFDDMSEYSSDKPNCIFLYPITDGFILKDINTFYYVKPNLDDKKYSYFQIYDKSTYDDRPIVYTNNIYDSISTENDRADGIFAYTSTSQDFIDESGKKGYLFLYKVLYIHSNGNIDIVYETSYVTVPQLDGERITSTPEIITSLNKAFVRYTRYSKDAGEVNGVFIFTYDNKKFIKKDIPETDKTNIFFNDSVYRTPFIQLRSKNRYKDGFYYFYYYEKPSFKDAKSIVFQCDENGHIISEKMLIGYMDIELQQVHPSYPQRTKVRINFNSNETLPSNYIAEFRINALSGQSYYYDNNGKKVFSSHIDFATTYQGLPLLVHVENLDFSESDRNFATVGIKEI